MKELINRAIKAKAFWLDNNLDEYDHVLLLPHSDSRLNNMMLAAFEKKLCNDSICSKSAVLSAAPAEGGDNYMSLRISEEIIGDLITLYSMYEFTDKLIIGSFDLPYGRKLKNMLGCNIACETDLVEVIIF